MLRRLALTATASAAALTGVGIAVGPAAGAAAAAAAAQSPGPLSLGSLLSSPDRLTVTVERSGNRIGDGTYKLECGPVGGTHPAAERACARLDQLARERKDPFAPVSKGSMCTHQYGGDATARITGTWRGQRIDARFSRANGCEIARWRNLEPVLPNARPNARPSGR
ncbi:SSI family serine proteinase inhibitor [Streptomyces sp. MUM 178J]|uniref:SSI family serine proteinase inhibitor n=1 Tax=Streptomyces sp. MUM 178J TaxID=2791991 RepID=UPI001F033933|nr:SSI family serine proteinase inhibitor [Streptomyces sp. MUM 178J]WRQ82595.1 SSI family serine proteinase inhibitor [Streptomyces sp. MUM 178J]